MSVSGCDLLSQKPLCVRPHIHGFCGKRAKNFKPRKTSTASRCCHNAMIVYGGAIADGNRHTHDNLPVILAGHGGGSLTPGRFIKHGSKPLTNLYLSMADRLGIRDVERFGDSEGRLANI